MNSRKLKQMDEEFDNFMYKVTEVNEIVKKLSSNDKKLQEIGTLEADKYLSDKAERELVSVDEENIELIVKSNRTLINTCALEEREKDENTLSQEAFMAEVSKDADRRYKDKMVRKEKMETQKKQATLAFRRGEYERALSCYTKAIEHIRDSPLLYNNRSLTHFKLGMYLKASEDARTALKLNENCLKSFLLLAKACYWDGKLEDYKETLVEAKKRNPSNIEFINEFQQQLETEFNEDGSKL